MHHILPGGEVRRVSLSVSLRAVLMQTLSQAMSSSNALSPVSGCHRPPRQAPAVLVSAPASGHGKTTVVAALARRLTRAGLVVHVFKVGPDFLDPAWHTVASGHVVHTLDLWMTGEADIRQRLYQAAASADLILIEGVMGLYDGEPSAAEMARRLDLPVLAVIDASSMTGTFGALAYGLRTWMPGLRWAGALANRVASPRHAQLLATACQRPGPPTPPMQQTGSQTRGRVGDDDIYLGSLARQAEIGLPARHLGLTPASELPDALQRLDAAADALSSTLLGELDRTALQRWQTTFLPPEQVPGLLTTTGAAGDASTVAPLAGRTIAIARDAAFSFIYPANLETLQALGARLCFFSPLADEPLPPCDAVWLPGGYPELHAGRLAGCRNVVATLGEHIAADRPLWAECGGMLPLFDQMQYEDRTWPMWGLLPGEVTFGKRTAGLGMQQLVWPPAGTGAAPAQHESGQPDDGLLRGHTFHYSRCTTPLPVIARTSRPHQPVDTSQGEAVYRHRCLHASYFHAWFASAPLCAAALFLPETAP